MSIAFRDFIQQVEPIKLKEPLTNTLEAIKEILIILEGE